jgi:hypothetical protein
VKSTARAKKTDLTLPPEPDVFSEPEGDVADLETLVPELRQRSEAPRGTPVEIAGREWRFADYIPELGPVWGRLYDQNALARHYESGDLRLGAVRLLWANYHLTPDEAVVLIRLTSSEDLVRAVEVAMLGPERVHRTYPDWVVSSFLANGLDLAATPPETRRDVLDQLVMTGRAVPPQEFISSAEAVIYRQSFLKRTN